MFLSYLKSTGRYVVDTPNGLDIYYNLPDSNHKTNPGNFFHIADVEEVEEVEEVEGMYKNAFGGKTKICLYPMISYRHGQLLIALNLTLCFSNCFSLLL